MVECLTLANDKRYYADLKRYLASGNNSSTTLRQLRAIPGLDISAELREAWEVAYRHQDRYEIAYLTPDTLATGYVPAFRFLFDALEGSNQLPGIFDPESLIKQFSDLRCSKQQLRAWQMANSEYIHFDLKTRRFTAESPQQRDVDRACPP
jgi:hypothetical protein